jgi:hypothetical protein
MNGSRCVPEMSAYLEVRSAQRLPPRKSTTWRDAYNNCAHHRLFIAVRVSCRVGSQWRPRPPVSNVARSRVAAVPSLTTVGRKPLVAVSGRKTVAYAAQVLLWRPPPSARASRRSPHGSRMRPLDGGFAAHRVRWDVAAVARGSAEPPRVIYSKIMPRLSASLALMSR